MKPSLSSAFQILSRFSWTSRPLGIAASAIFTIFLGCPQAAAAGPANDNFAAAQLLSNAMTGQINGSNINATRETGEPYHAGVGGYASVWYTWIPGTSGYAAFTLGGSNFDTVLAVYTGNSIATLREVASNDDTGNLTSRVNFVAQAGTPYRIAVDGFGGSMGTFYLSWLQDTSAPVPVVNSGTSASASVGAVFSYQITATNQPTSFGASGLPSGLKIDATTGLISGTPTTKGTYTVTLRATNVGGTGTATLALTVAAYTRPVFFDGQTALGNGVYYLSFPTGNYFGYYSFLNDPHYIYHFDLGYEYIFDAADGQGGVYLYDFTSSDFFYTSPTFPFPYLYDFNLKVVLYYFSDPDHPGHYNTNGVRYFGNTSTGEVIVK